MFPSAAKLPELTSVDSMASPLVAVHPDRSPDSNPSLKSGGGADGRVTTALAEIGETFPVWSVARMAYAWVEPGRTVVSLKDVTVPTLARRVPSRRMSYPATPLLSVDALQVTCTAKAVPAVAVTLPGTDGTDVSPFGPRRAVPKAISS